MATRRPRIKVPNLGIGRNKARPLSKKDVIESSENVKVEIHSAVTQPRDNNVGVQSNDEDAVKSVDGDDELAVKKADLSAGVPLPAVKSVLARRPRLKAAPILSRKRNKTVALPIQTADDCTVEAEQEVAVTLSTSVVTALGDTPDAVDSETVFSVVTSPLPIGSVEDDNEASDWEDDQFAYKSIEVEQEKIFPPIEITQMNVDVSNALVDDVSNTQVDTNSNSVVSKNVNPTEKTAENMKTTGCKPRPRMPVMRSKFRPNLHFDSRIRRNSGPGAGMAGKGGCPARPRTVSGSSTESDTGAGRLTTCRPRSPLLTSPRPARIRRITETSRSGMDRSQFLRRKQDHKKKFSKGVPERGNLTMFDLIYYNPEHGQRMSIDDEEDKNDETVDDPTAPGKREPSVEAEAPVQPAVPTEPPPEKEDAAILVPQVKVGLNGEIILDESSLQVETTDQKKAKILLNDASVVVENNQSTSNYGSWSKKRRHFDWSDKETIKFYKVLSVVGSDFSMMESIFKNRSRQELKLKFKKEERNNGKIIDKCLRERGMYTDLDALMKESEEEEEEFEQPVARSRKRKRTLAGSRRVYKNRGYYDTSSEDEGGEGDVECSRSPDAARPRPAPRQQTRPVARIKRPAVSRGRGQAVVPAVPQQQPATLQPQQPAMVAPPDLLNGVQFPPGLLAANPSLAGAQPGSLVVVASPNKADPDTQLLHVYMVAKKKAAAGAAVGPTGPVDRSPSPRPPADLTLDPAVVRAVDRRRAGWRNRTVSESFASRTGKSKSDAEEESFQFQFQAGKSRIRTCSESGLTDHGGNLRTSSIKNNFLSGGSKR